MTLFTTTQRNRLFDNGRQNSERIATTGDTIDFKPVVKLFTPDANCTWLLSEIDPERPDIAFGLCDLGMGCPELGSVSLSELRALRGRLGLPVERDCHFTPAMTLAAYAAAAQRVGGIS